MMSTPLGAMLCALLLRTGAGLSTGKPFDLDAGLATALVGGGAKQTAEHRDVDDLEAKEEALSKSLDALAWHPCDAAQGPCADQPSLVLTILNRARLGNRLFQWAALLSIAREAHVKVAAPSNPKYTPESTPQMSRLGRVILQPEQYEWLGQQPNKCHVWDRIPLKLDWNLNKLANFTLGGIPKGEKQLLAEDQPERGQNWAKKWAKAIVKTQTPSPCRIVELDGYWQSAEFFIKHVEWIRSLFWHDETAAKGKQALSSRLEHEGVEGAVVGVHLRLGDYLGAGRNLNMSYYYEALDIVKQRRGTDKLTCLIFSDDIGLAEKVGAELQACTKTVPVYPCPDPWVNKFHCRGREVGDWVQFYMMSQLDNIVIADSSYSFWSALLAPNNPLVVVPKIVWPLGVAIRGDYLYMNNPLYGWTNVNATLGEPDSKAVREHLHLALDRSASAVSEWGA